MNIDNHPTACISPSSAIGAGTSVGPYAVVSEETVIGRACRVGGHAVFTGKVSVGDESLIGAGACIQGPVKSGRRVEIGPNTCLAGDPSGPIEIREGAVIRAQAVITAGVTIGEGALVEAGAVVTKNVPATAIVSGNPARIVGYAATMPAAPILETHNQVGVIQTDVRGVTLHHLPDIEDLRGNLTFGEAGRHVPFPIRRYFMTFDVASEEVRGEHAHRTLHQFLICSYGRVHIMADDGTRRAEFVLDRPSLALHLPPMVWGVQYRFSPGAVLLVLCSDYYDPSDYIRDYREFLDAVNTQGIPSP